MVYYTLNQKLACFALYLKIIDMYNIIGFPSQFNINSIQIDFQIIQFRANLYAHLKVYFNLQLGDSISIIVQMI